MSRMRLRRWSKQDPGLEQRIQRIADLARRRDRLLEAPALDLPALRRLLAEYEAAGLVCAAADLRKRIEWYGVTLE